jgi:thiol-disulfide isomerase/thioredoxin
MVLNRIIFSSLLLFLVLSFGCSQDSQIKTPTFSISGQIKNPQKGQIVLVQQEDINRKKIRPIGVLQTDDNGSFSADFDLEPHIYTLDIYGKKTITLAIDKGQKISIKADGNDLSKIEITGSEDTKLLEDYENFRNESLERLVKSVRVKISDLERENDPANASEIGKLGVAEVENYEKHKAELNEFIKNKMGTSIAVYPTSLRWDGENNIPFFESLASEFEKAHPNLAISKRLKEKVEVLKNTSIGGKAMEIKMTDKNGKEIALSSIKGKYILIDFWASWCGPCRRESKIVASLYEKYKDKGFEIYGVSLDSEKDTWLKAIEQDERIWTNVSTLQGFETPATFEYAVTALPAKFIIDSEGKIIAKNLHGKELKEKIESLFR